VSAVIWTPLDALGQAYAKLWFAPNPGVVTNTGAPRLVRATLSYLFARESVAPAPPNLDSGVEALLPDATIPVAGSSARTETSGDWVDYPQPAGAAMVRYSTGPGAVVTYTVQGATRIDWRSFANPTVAGRVQVDVSGPGGTIDESQWQVGKTDGQRLVNLRYTTTANGARYALVPIARGLDRFATYTVTLTQYDGPRLFDGGLRIHAGSEETGGYPVDREGRYGAWDAYPAFPGIAAALWPGSRVVYRTRDCTSISWRTLRRANAGRARVTIYDANGLEVAPECYPLPVDPATGAHVFDGNGATAPVSVVIGTNLPPGNFFVHLSSADTTSATAAETAGGSYLSSRWALYDGGLDTVDVRRRGVPGIDTMIDTPQQFFGGGSDPLDGGGNLGMAMQVRDEDDPSFLSIVETGFVSNVHGAESAADSVVVERDGVALDWNALPDGSEFTAGRIDFRFRTRVGTRIHPDRWWARADYRYGFSSAGMEAGYSLVATRPVRVGAVYGNMLTAPNPTASNGTLLGSGFRRILVEPGAVYDVRDKGVEGQLLAGACLGAVFFSDEGYGTLEEPMFFSQSLRSRGGDQYLRGFFVDRARTAKLYGSVIGGQNGGPEIGDGEPTAAGGTVDGALRVRFVVNPAAANAAP
jgi:hypothetical protein